MQTFIFRNRYVHSRDKTSIGTSEAEMSEFQASWGGRLINTVWIYSWGWKYIILKIETCNIRRSQKLYVLFKLHITLTLYKNSIAFYYSIQTVYKRPLSTFLKKHPIIFFVRKGRNF